MRRQLEIMKSQKRHKRVWDNMVALGTMIARGSVNTNKMTLLSWILIYQVLYAATVKGGKATIAREKAKQLN